jgi:hypothetical protein
MHPQQEAADRDDEPADHVEELAEIAPAVLALLAATVALLEAVSGLARLEAPPALFSPSDHVLCILPATRPA